MCAYNSRNKQGLVFKAIQFLAIYKQNIILHHVYAKLMAHTNNNSNSNKNNSKTMKKCARSAINIYAPIRNFLFFFFISFGV